MLSVVISVLHFKHFTYGCHITVITDHKPLITLFKKNIAASSPRLLRMLIKITDFQIDLLHQEGSKMHLSDANSHFNTHDSDDARNNAVPIADFNISIHEVEDITGFKPVTMQEIQTATASDIQLTQLKRSFTVLIFEHKFQFQLLLPVRACRQRFYTCLSVYPCLSIALQA